MVTGESLPYHSSTLAARVRLLHDVRMRLFATQSSDELCHQAVTLGCAHLGFDRLSIWFPDGPASARGSYGVDEAGQIRDERQARVAVADDSPMGRILRGDVDLLIEGRDTLLDHAGAGVGHGSHAIAALWDGIHVLGTVSADNLLTHAPITDEDGEVLRLYASIIGHLYLQRQAEREQQTRQRFSAYALDHSLDELLRHILDEAEHLTGSQIGFFHFLDADGQALTLQTWSTNTVQRMCTAARKVRHYPVDQAGIWVECLQQRQPVVHNDYAGLAQRKGLPEGHAPVLRELTVPVIQQDRIVAIIGVGNKPNLYTETDVQRVSALAHLLIDIVARKQAEEALGESRAMMSTIVDSSPDMIWSVDADDFGLLAFNQSLSRYFREKGDLTLDVGMTSKDLFPTEEFQQRWRELYQRALREGPFTTEYQSYHGPQILQLTFSLLSREGQVFGISVFARDITARTQTEAARREAVERFQRAFRTSPDAININRMADGLYLEINDGFTRMTGYTAADVLGRSSLPGDLSVWVHAEDRARLLDGLCAHGEVMDLEALFRCKDGTTRICQMSASLLDINGETCILSITRDITAHRQAEKALRESEEQYRSLFENDLNGVALHKIILDDAGTPVDYIFLQVNPAFEKHTGMRPADILGQRVTQVYPDIANTGLLAKYGRVALTGEPVAFELFFPPLQRHYAISAYQVGYGYFAVVFADITARKQAEEALRASEERYRLLFSELMDGCALHSIVCDAQGNAIDYITLDVNRAYETLLTVPREAVIGMRASALLPPEELRHWLDIFAPVALTGSSTHYQLFSSVNNRYFEGVAYSPEIGLFAVVFTDITARKQAEEERDKLQAQLAQAQRLESVGRLAGGVAHDFNNMLCVIMGNAEIVMEQLNPADPLLADLTEIQKAAKRSADLTRQLLAFARKQTVAPEVLDLNETITGMLKMLRRLLGEDIDLVWWPATDLWFVHIDPAQIDQILANLCVNARDAIASLGKITIETHNIVVDATIKSVDQLEAHPGEYVLLTVSDNGGGITPEVLAHIFEPFFTTKGVGEGTGLGLATVYGIVKQNHGFINVYSEPDQGTTFRIYLPRHHEHAATHDQRRAVARSPHGHETVLLVEDEPSILHLGKRVLTQHGYKVLIASTPGEAIRLADEHPGEIHLLMTDVVMPEMNGRELSARLLARYPTMKCLFMSGYTANVIAHHGVLDEGVNFLQKPFTVFEMAAMVRAVLDA